MNYLRFLIKITTPRAARSSTRMPITPPTMAPLSEGVPISKITKQKYIREIKNILCLAYCHSNQNVITVTSDIKNRHCVVFIRTYLALQELDITHTTRFHYCTVLPHVLFNILTELTITISVHVPQFWWINKSSPQILSDVKLPGVFSTYPGSHLDIRKTHLVKLNNSKNKFISFSCIYCTESFHIRCPFLADVGWITDAKGSTFTSFTHSITNWSTCKIQRN